MKCQNGIIFVEILGMIFVVGNQIFEYTEITSLQIQLMHAATNDSHLSTQAYGICDMHMQCILPHAMHLM